MTDAEDGGSMSLMGNIRTIRHNIGTSSCSGADCKCTDPSFRYSTKCGRHSGGTYRFHHCSWGDTGDNTLSKWYSKNHNDNIDNVYNINYKDSTYNFKGSGVVDGFKYNNVNKEEYPAGLLLCAVTGKDISDGEADAPNAPDSIPSIGDGNWANWNTSKSNKGNVKEWFS